jgi:hypothetical protein
MANSLSSLTAGVGGVQISSVDTSGSLDIKSGTTTIVSITSAGAAVTGTLSSTSGALNGTLGATTPSTGVFTDVNTPNTFGFKNRIINGDMRIAQRATTATAQQNANSYLTVDRWKTYFYGVGVATQAQIADAPSGFNYSTRFTVTTPDSTIAGADDYVILQAIEANNTTDFAYGTASAKTITLSFWVKCSTTGTLSVAFQNGTADRSYVTTVTINASNTWEQKTITIAGDTTGTWYNASNTPTGAGLQVYFNLGNSKPTTANSWQAGNLLGVTGATNFMATNGLTIQFTGVQLELGSTATSFDVRDYGRELAMCQRYYTKILSFTVGYNILAPATAASTNTAGAFISYPVTMRTAPTFSYANIILADGAVSSVVNSIVATWAGTNTANVTFSGATANLTTYRPTPLIANNTASAFIDMSAEL